MKEIIWKDVIELDSQFETNYLGELKRKSDNKLIKANIDGKGYYQYRINVNGKYKTFLKHRLIAIYFIPNPENKPQVNHINLIKTDNSLDNLEWVTCSENIIHAYKNGLCKRKYGVDNHKAKLNEKQVLEIYNHILSYSKIAKLYNISKKNVLAIKHKLIWKHLHN